MNTFIVTPFLLALLTFCGIQASQLGSSIQTRPLSYTDTLLSGLKRSSNRAFRTNTLVNAVSNIPCDLICPLGAVCSIQYGRPRCIVPNSLIRDTVNPSYNEPILGITNTQGGHFIDGLSANRKIVAGRVGATYNDPILSLTDGHGALVVDPALTLNTNQIRTIGGGYDRPILSSSLDGHILNTNSLSNPIDLGMGLSGCGVFPTECRALPQQFNTATKYTFDYTLNRCVQISVCSSCALYNGPRVNLFNDFLDCNRFCQ